MTEQELGFQVAETLAHLHALFPGASEPRCGRT
jgi:hypothetical protein